MHVLRCLWDASEPKSLSPFESIKSGLMSQWMVKLTFTTVSVQTWYEGIMTPHAQQDCTLSFSVVIPLYNKCRAVESMLKSVLNQEFGSFEVVIVDDGSTDGSLEAILPLLDKRCRVIEQPNQGVSVARNRGIEAAQGRYIALMDADDYWYPDHLSTAAAFFNGHPEVKWISSNWQRIGSVEMIPVRVESEYNFEICNYFESGHTEDKHPVWTSALSFERDAFSEIAIFPVGVKRGQDLYGWYKMALKERFFGWSAHITALYNDVSPLKRAILTEPCEFIERLMEELWHLGPPRSKCVNFHIQNMLRCYVELEDPNGLLRFLKRYKEAMSGGFWTAWWVIAQLLTLCGRRFTTSLLEGALQLRRRLIGKK